MRIRVLLSTMALLLASSAAQAQYGSSPSQPFLHPENPSIYGQIDFGGRLTSIDGDQARYQRYRDLGDGVFFDLTGLHKVWGNTTLEASMRNAGWNDQQYKANLNLPGLLRVRFLYDQTPTFISRDTRTPYDPLPGSEGIAGTTLRLPDTLQETILANPAANFRPLIESQAGSRFFDSRIRRDTLGFDVRYTMGSVDASVSYGNTGKQGNIPFGAYLQIPIEIPLPIDSRADDVRASIEWASAKGLLRVGFDGSKYDNHISAIVWDNPQRSVDSSTAGSQGRMAEWPSNTMSSSSIGGAYRFPAHTTINGMVAFGRWNQNATLLPFTINTAVTFLPPLARPTAAAKADTSTVVLNVVSRPSRYIDLGARYRYYDFDNKTPEFDLARTDGNPDRVTADGAAGVWSNPAIGKIGTEPLGYRRQYVDLDAGVAGLPNTTVRVGYSRYTADTHFRVYEGVRENTYRAGADVIGNQYVSFRGVYEHSERRGRGLDLIALAIAAEQPGMRHFDIASRDRDRVTAVAGVTPTASVGLNASVAWSKDSYLGEDAEADRFGLRSASSKAYTLGMDIEPRDGLSAELSFSVEDYGGSQQSRTASPGAQQLDPTRNWTMNEGNKAFSGIAGIDWLRGIKNTELRFSYNYSTYRGTYGFQLPAATTLPTPAPLPPIESTESRASVDVRYFLTRRIALGLVYWYSDYSVSDFTLSPDVVSGVAQPAVEEGQNATVNALLLNYFYRPYRAHTGWLRLTYAF